MKWTGNSKSLLSSGRVLARAIMAGVLLVWGGGASASPASQNSHLMTNQQPPAHRSDEYLLLGSATRGAGEPMIAVDPKNPQNMIAVGMGSLQHLGTKAAPALEVEGYRAIFHANPMHHFNGLTDAYHAVPFSTITWIAVTHSGGDSWKVARLPILSGSFTRCPDPFAGVLPNGTFLAGCEPRQTTGKFYGKSTVLRSYDHGDTWSRPADIISSYGAKRFAAGLAPRIGGNSPWDRPYVVVDGSTGIVYGVAEGGQGVVSQHPATYHWELFITASLDGAKHFGKIYAWDSKDYPELSRGLGVAAARGAIGVVYVASKAPASDGAKCPCVVFGISQNQGKTFARHVLQNAQIMPASPGRAEHGFVTGGISGLAADPSKAGRFALLRYVGGSSPAYEVSVSDDYGKTWSNWTLAGHTADAVHLTKPWITYSQKGVLGLMWRASYSNRSYDIWSALSSDGGRTFSRSLKISHRRSPVANPYRNDGLFGDDIQDMVINRKVAHFVWGDSRAGFQGVWYGSVPLSAYSFAQAHGARRSVGGRVRYALVLVGIGGAQSGLRRCMQRIRRWLIPSIQVAASKR